MLHVYVLQNGEGALTCAMTCAMTCARLRAIDSAKCEMINSDNILQFAKFNENLSFLINSASRKIKTKFYILITF